MGNQVGVEQTPEDWLTDEAVQQNPLTTNYPRTFRHYLHVWKFSPSPAQPDQILFQPVSIPETLNTFTDTEVYLILHIQYPRKTRSTKSVSPPDNPDPGTLNWTTLFSSLSSIAAPSVQDPLIANHNIQKTAKSNTAPFYEIFVWFGLKATALTQSTAIAKARKCNQILESVITEGGFIKKVTTSAFVPLNCNLDASNEVLQSQLKINPLLKSLFELNPSTKRKSLRGDKQTAIEARQIPSIIGFPIPAANKKAAYLDSKKKQNAAIKSMGALKLEGISETRGQRYEPSEAKIKSDKLDQCSKECSRIVSDLYLAGETVASDKEILKRTGITHILNCAGTYCPEYFPQDFVYKTLHLYDGKNEDISCFFLKVLDFITNAFQENGSVLVHCQQGVSRSSAFVIMYLMWKLRKSFDETHKMVKQERAVSNPNTGFIFQLLLWEKRLGLNCSQSAYPWMVYIAPHSQTDPQEMVLRTVEAKFSSLDPRGVFLLQTKENLFVWIGSSAHPALVSGSEEYLNYFLKFLRTSNDFVRIHQGEEPVEFCEIIGLLDPTSITEKTQYTQFFDLLPSLENPSRLTADSSNDRSSANENAPTSMGNAVNSQFISCDDLPAAS